MISMMISFIRQLGTELLDAADELDKSEVAAKPGDTVRVIAMAVLAASRKTLLS